MQKLLKTERPFLQRLERSASESQVVAEQPAEVSSASSANSMAVSEAPVVSVESPVPDTMSLSDGAIAPQLRIPETPPFSVLKTAFVSICTSIVATAALTALAFVSESFVVSPPETSVTRSGAPSGEKNRHCRKATVSGQPKQLGAKGQLKIGHKPRLQTGQQSCCSRCATLNCDSLNRRG